MQKTVIFAFKGNPICFVHVLLNGLDIDSKGGKARIVLEGEASGLVTKLKKQAHPLHKLYKKAKDKGLIEGVCRACASKMGSLEDVKAEGLRLLEDMSGHAGMALYIEDNWTVVTL